MRVFYLSVLVLLNIFIQYTYQDVYLHNPRGSNNRLNENTSERKNANRAFDSQVNFLSSINLYLNNALINETYKYI